MFDFESLINSIPLDTLGYGAYTVLFLIAVIEALPLVGTFIPGHSLVILSGFLVRLGTLDLWPVLFIVSLGAIVGDVIGYRVGKKYGYDLIRKFGKYFFITEAHLQKAKDAMNRHTGKALVIGRFSPVTRAFTPFLAGAGDVHVNKFWLYNISGGILWSVSSVLVGYVFGASYEIASQYIGKFVGIAIILSILIVWAYRFINRQQHIFAKYHFYTLLVNITSLYIFFKTIQDVFSVESSLAELDVWVNLKMMSIQNVMGADIFTGITNFFGPVHLVLAGLAIACYLMWKKRIHQALVISFALLGGALFQGVLKELVERVRPENAVILETGFSFPSGHATMAAIFFCALIYVFGGVIKNKIGREIFGTLSLLLFILVGFSRVYLNVHWVSDVIAGFALGAFWLTALILFFKFASTAIRGQDDASV